MTPIDDDFQAAVATVPTLTEDPGNAVKLRLYALYKQATEGDVAGERPGMLDIVGRAKYDAWAKVTGMGEDDAKREYVDVVRGLTG